MKTKLLLLIIFCFAFSTNSLFAQKIKNKPQKPYYIGVPTKVEQVPSIASRSNLVRPEYIAKEVLDGRASKYNIVPGKGSVGADALAKNPHHLKNKIPTKAPELVFETASTGSQPTDPAGAVGPNHYVSVTNTAFQIFDKDGNSLTGGLVSPNPTIFPSGGCCDLTVSYDNAADRWVISFLGVGVQIAVSNGPDPVNDGWTTYSYNIVRDYQKLSVWRDGYYMTENTRGGEKLHVFDRAAMIAGNTNAAIQSFQMPGLVTSGFHSAQALNISNSDIPTSGGATIVYMQDDAWDGVEEDHIKLWNVDIDWATPANSQISAATILGTAEGVTPFVGTFDGGAFTNLLQPNGGAIIDALQAIIMNQAQFRKFATHNSAIFNFVVDVADGEAKQAAVRWYELRQTGDGQPWSVYQEGTYTAPDNRHAWNASMIMDLQGNIGMGYTSMSSSNSTNLNVVVGSYYSGRFNNDPLGVMTVAEEVIMAGDANIPADRYGDYSKIDIDPDGDRKFWFVNELMSNGRKNITGVFQFAPNSIIDIGVISVDSPNSGTLTNNESVTVTIFNFGVDDVSGFDVTYQIDGGAVITEPFVGTLASQASGQHTFTTTSDLSIEEQTYAITSCVGVLAGDEDATNDCITSNITHILANDIGVTEITSPITGEGFANETITVTVENFGTTDQSGFDINYIINGGTPVVENIAATLPGGAAFSYSFATTANLSAIGTYTISSSTLLGVDSNNSNDTATTMLSNNSCLTSTYNDGNLSIGPDAGTVTTSIVTFSDNFLISDVNVTVNLEHSYNSDLLIKLIAPNNTEVILSNRNGGRGDNYTNTVFDDEASNSITAASSPFTGSFQPQENLASLDGIQSSGNWTLSITDNEFNDGGQLLNWSLSLCSNTRLSVDDVLVQEGITIIYKDNNHYLINLPTNSITERLHMNVYNVLGQNLLWQTLENKNGQGYTSQLNMSHVSPGVYFVKIGNGHASNIKRIIVK